jgi:hypothetical protein
MRRILILSLLAACSAAALPSPAAAKLNGRSFPYDFSVQGTIKESWKIDNDTISDGCGRKSIGSGGATLAFATPKPIRLTLGVYTGFHSKPKVNVTVDRTGDVTTSEAGFPCDDPPPTAAGCGHRAFGARVSVRSTGLFAPQLSRGDREVYRGCPLPGDWRAPQGLGFDGRFQTVDVLTEDGPNVDVSQVLFGGCDGKGHCKHAKKKNVIHFTKHIELPFHDYGQDAGTYTADIDWTVTFVARYKLA